MALYHETCTLGNHPFAIRNAEPGDAEAMIAHVRQVDTESVFLAREPGEFTMTVEEEARFLEQVRDSDHRIFLIAETDGTIVACCDAAINPRIRFRHKAVIGIAVRRDYWSMGIGRRLMNALIGWCRTQGLAKVELTVDAENQRAFSLYTSLGFVVEGTIRKALRLADGTYRDTYAMGLFLEE